MTDLTINGIQPNYPIVHSEVMKPIIEDMGSFLAELEIFNEQLNQVVQPIREKMLEQERIYVCADSERQEGLQAVDSASAIMNRSGLAVINTMAVRVGQGEQINIQHDRQIGPNNQGFRSLTMAQRLQLEFRLLQDAAPYTIIDNSFWSLLMNSNKVVTDRRKSWDVQVKQFLENVWQECFRFDGSFILSLRNTNLVAMSKTATGTSLSSRWNIDPPMSDRTLFSRVLEENEYTRPEPLVNATNANFGVERRPFGVERGLDNWEEIRDIYQDKRKGLAVSFYKPWAFQRAYRIEFHRSVFDRERFEELLSLIKYETRTRTIMEPASQFLADMICKQGVSEGTQLYVQAAVNKYPILMGPYRTGG